MKKTVLFTFLCLLMQLSRCFAQEIKQYTAQLVLEAGAQLGEGPIWDSFNNRFYWVDIEKGFLHTYHPESEKTTSKEIGQRVSTVVPTRYGNVILGLEDGIYVYNLNTGRRYLMAHPEKDKPENRLNDGKCDPQGRFWIGSMHKKILPQRGALYRLSPNFSIRKMLDSVSISNGIVWTADGKILYYIDTPTQKVFAFDFDAKTGNISNRRIAIHIPEELGSPDGMAIDQNDNVWIGMWGGGCVTHWNPKTGQLIGKINVPGAKNVTACAFGGKEMRQMFITTAKEGISEAELEQYPNSGHAFLVELDVAGQQPHYFKER